MKLRPVLLLSEPAGPVPEVLVAYISSVIPASLLATDVLLDPAAPEHAMTGLRAASVLRLHKLATIHQTSIMRRLGALSPASLSDCRLQAAAVPQTLNGMPTQPKGATFHDNRVEVSAVPREAPVGRGLPG